MKNISFIIVWLILFVSTASGQSSLPEIANLSALASYSPTPSPTANQSVFVDIISAMNNVSGGIYQYQATLPAGLTADGVLIVTASQGGYWIKVLNGRITPQMYGAQCSTMASLHDATSAYLPAAAAAAAVARGLPLVIDCGIYLQTPTMVMSSSVTNNLDLQFVGAGSGGGAAGGQLIWNFGHTDAVKILSPGRGYSRFPTASIAADGSGKTPAIAVQMGVYYATPATSGITGCTNTGTDAAGNPIPTLLTVTPAVASDTAPLLSATIKNNIITIVAIADPGSLSQAPSGALTGDGCMGATATLQYDVVGATIANPVAYTLAQADVPPMVMFSSAGLQTAMAVVTGDMPYLGGTITAPGHQILAGYKRFTGAPNNGEADAAWFGASPSNSDNTASIQAALDSDVQTDLELGTYIVGGSLLLGKYTKLRGAVVAVPLGSTMNSIGTQIYGVSTAQQDAVVWSPPGNDNSGINVSNLSIATSKTSYYLWAGDFNNFNTSAIESVEGSNSSVEPKTATQPILGCGRFGSDKTGPSTDTNYAYGTSWIDHVTTVHCSTTTGAPFQIEVTDSKFTDIYGSHGSGSVIAGANLMFAQAFFDDSTGGPCVTIQPTYSSMASISWGSGALQKCGTDGILISSPNGSAQAMNVSIGPVALSHSHGSGASIHITNSTNVTVSGASTGTTEATTLLCDGATDFVHIDAYLVNQQGYCDSNSIVFGGSDNQSVSTGTTYTLNVGRPALVAKPAPVEIVQSTASGSSSQLVLPLADQAERTVGSAGVTVPLGISRLILTFTTGGPAPITMPASPVDGQTLVVECSNSGEQATVSPNTGQSLAFTNSGTGMNVGCTPPQTGHQWHFRTNGAVWFQDF